MIGFMPLDWRCLIFLYWARDSKKELWGVIKKGTLSSIFDIICFRGAVHTVIDDRNFMVNEVEDG